jgi:hypothetical protein
MIEKLLNKLGYEKIKAAVSVFKLVENKNRYRTASPYYYAVIDIDGARFLFTEKDLDVARTRAASNPEDFS